MRDSPTYGAELATLTKRDPHRRVFGSVGKKRARSKSMSAVTPAAVPEENAVANLLRDVVLNDLCALLNSAAIYAPYKRYVRKMCENI